MFIINTKNYYILIENIHLENQLSETEKEEKETEIETEIEIETEETEIEETETEETETKKLEQSYNVRKKFLKMKEEENLFKF